MPLSLYASYSQSFQPAGSIFANALPKPEEGTQYEVGIKADLSNRLSSTLAFYNLTRTNVTTADLNNPLLSIQVGEQRSRGIEFDISGEILPGWNMIAGYAYTDAEVTKDNTFAVGDLLNNIPKHSFNLWTTYEIQSGGLKGFGIGAGVFYVGDRQGDLANTFELPSYLRTDAAIFYKRDRFRAALNFKIKWNAHLKRTNFDIHKVAGIIAAVFLTMIAFTGVCWNFWDFSQPVIYAATFTPIPPTPVSQLIKGKSPLRLDEILKKADAALPGAATTYMSLPQTPEGVFRVGKKQPEETWEYGRSQVYLDQYTGKVVQLKNGLEPSRADVVFNSFSPMHYGTFGGLPTRILYIFVGLSPLILSITGFVMWWYRYKGKNPREKSMKMIEP